jgi:hypothetical protein
VPDSSIDSSLKRENIQPQISSRLIFLFSQAGETACEIKKIQFSRTQDRRLKLDLLTGYNRSMRILIHMVVLLGLLSQNWSGFPAATVILQQVDCSVPSGFSVRFHPDDELRAGDQVSIEVTATRRGIDFNHQAVSVSWKTQLLGKAGFGNTGFGSFNAVLQWVWNTQGLSPGTYQLSFAVLPSGISWTQTVTLHDPLPDANLYQWKAFQTDCCVVNYISHTAVERDLSHLVPLVQARAEQAAAALHTTLPSDRIVINLIPRVLGQGGFTTDEIYVSYPDQPFSDADFGQVLEHEMIHRLDAEMGGKYKPIFFVEGLAVYTTGGHYNKEPLVGRAAALYRLGWYLPLGYLADNFYPSQHETSYLEAATVITYMVNTWGWDAFLSFYHDIQASKSGDADAIDKALQQHFSITFEQLEDRYITMLENQPVNPDLENDVRSTFELYDAMRSYQQKLDPSAYYRQLWTPSAKDARAKQIVGDYLRHPVAPINQEIEGLLAAASQDLISGRYSAVESNLFTIQQRLLKLPVQNCAPEYNTASLTLSH